jgi:hypothetical protein
MRDRIAAEILTSLRQADLSTEQLRRLGEALTNAAPTPRRRSSALRVPDARNVVAIAECLIRRLPSTLRRAAAL